LWRANGFRIVPLPATDIITQLKMHNLDAVPETALYAETTQLYSLTPYMSTVKWAPLVGATILARQVWESIPAAQREAMLGAARRSGEAVKQDIRAQGARAIAAMTKGQPGRKALKLTVIEPDAAALAEWRRQTEAIYPKMKDKMIPADLFDEVQRLRDEYRARHPVARSAQPTLEMLAQPTLEIKGAAQGATQTKGAAR
jgi:TRAP-type C4-dicarboxylate transport system substrate-binding protein